MSDIPTDIVQDILVRIPADDLARFRCVHKSWQQIIDDAAFTKTHLINQMGGKNLFIINTMNGCNLYSISLVSLYNNPECETKTIEPKIVKNVTLKGIPRVHYLPLASCDGLVLVSHDERKWALWNILTRECSKLPPFRSVINVRGDFSDCAGLGYDTVTDDYKVVRVFRLYLNSEYTMETIIYSLKSNNWHRIDHYPNCCRMTYRDRGVFFNGAIHWVAYIKQGEVEVEMIIVLDLSTEKYHHIPLPPLSKQGMIRPYLSGLNDCLILSYAYDAWILNDYGGEEIWTKFLSVKHVGMVFDYRTRLLVYIKSNEQVLIQDGDKGFFRYNLQTGCAEKVTIKGLRSGFTCQVFPTSLIRLNGSNMEGTLNEVET